MTHAFWYTDGAKVAAMKKTFYESERDNKNKVIHILLYNTECKMHFHNATEILFVKKGRVHYSCLSDNDILHPGEAVFLPAFFSHRFHSEEETETETLMIPYKYLHNFRKYYENVSFPKLDNVEANKEIYALFQKVLQSTTNGGNEFLTSALIDHILAVITSNYPPIPYNKEHLLMVDIAKYINDNFSKIHSITDVSSHFGYNVSYFSRLFKKLFECPFNKYLNRMRCDFIENNRGTAPITELIYRAGFESTCTYYRNKQKSDTTFRT